MNSDSFVVIVSAPSGAGKSSLARELARRRRDVAVATSATTRDPRPGERPGQSYLFVDEGDFDRMLSAGELAEWAQVHGKRYGTPRSEIDGRLANGEKVVLDIDVQGARQIRQQFPDNVSIFVLPPTGDELLRRLAGRGSEDLASKRRRLETALVELTMASEFDYIIVNDQFEVAMSVLDGIITAREHETDRAIGLDSGLKRLSEELRSIIERSQ